MKQSAGILARMVKYRTIGRWFLVPIALTASTVAAWFAMWLSFGIDQATLPLLASAHLNFPPSDLLHIADLLSMFFIALIWVIPIAWAVGFAAPSRTSVALLWGFSISLLLTAVFVWFEGQRLSRVFAIAAAVTAICGMVFLVIRKLRLRSLWLVEFGSFCLLLVPSLYVLASVPRQPSAARKVWSVVLQKGTWQAMNTGSEFGATRQLTFAGDRIIAVFDAGFSSYQGKQPMSKYRVVSLDRDTGAIRDQMEFTGLWGAMPYVFGTDSGKIVLIGPGPAELLNPNLSRTGIALTYRGIIHDISPDGSTLAWETLPGTTLLASNTLQSAGKISQSNPVSLIKTAVLNTDHYWYRDFPKDTFFVTLTNSSGEHLLLHNHCGSIAQFLSEERILIVGCGRIRILDPHGRAVTEAKNIDRGGLFAGVSQNGNRFALEYSDERGDPSVLLYERFVIYDTATAAPVASVLMDSLPEQQSWSAFSPDGRYFAVGNPNKLTLYSLP